MEDQNLGLILELMQEEELLDELLRDDDDVDMYGEDESASTVSIWKCILKKIIFTITCLIF